MPVQTVRIRDFPWRTTNIFGIFGKGCRTLLEGLKRFFAVRAGRLFVFALGLSFLLGFSVLRPTPAKAGDAEVKVVPKKSAGVKSRGTVRKASLRRRASRRKSSRIFASGNGSVKSPWIVRTAAQMEALARSVNQGNSYSGKRIRLVADLDLSGMRWNPIGFYREGGSRPFKGFFDGNGHVVRGLDIKAPAAGMAGLFGVLEGATVVGLTIEDASVSGGSNVGILAGLAVRSELRNCAVSGSVLGTENVGGVIGQTSESRLSGLSFSGAVNGRGSGTGGLIGSMFGTLLARAEVRGEISGQDNVGGLAGNVREGELNEARTWELTVQGRKTVGGMIGFASDSVVIRRSLFDGTVEGRENTGGLVGWVESGNLTGNSVSGSVLGWERTGGVAGLWGDGLARRCIVEATVSGTSDVGGLAGRMEKGLANQCESLGYVEGGKSVGGLVGEMVSGRLEKCMASGSVKGALTSGREIGSTSR